MTNIGNSSIFLHLPGRSILSSLSPLQQGQSPFRHWRFGTTLTQFQPCGKVESTKKRVWLFWMV